ncbi:MAG: extracellular solute-binding protein, partial [Pseudomonadota bacterium]
MIGLRARCWAGALLAALALPVAAGAGEGFSLFGPLKHAEGFAHFDYVNPTAPKGGTLRQGTLLAADSTNPLRFSGRIPNELGLAFDSLMVRAQDEPASFYGLLAGDVAVADDLSHARFRLRPEARWQDGTPVTSRDVAFTFRTLRQYGLPGHRAALKDLAIETPDDAVVEFRSPQPADWRYLALVATFPIQSQAFWQSHDVSAASREIPLGSGPYRVEELELTEQTVLVRDPAYWGRDLPVNRGRWNIDRIVTQQFRDRISLVEAIKAGKLDIHREFDPSLWANGYDGPRLAAGELLRSSFRERAGGRLAAMVFNLRRPPLDQRPVRAALVCALDTEWARETLFEGTYDPPGSPYGQSEFAATGPAGPGERALLAPFLESLPEGILEAPAPPSCNGLSRRERLRRADRLLHEAGWDLVDGRRVNEQNRPLEIEYVSAPTGLERAMPAFRETLATLGIRLEVTLHTLAGVRDEILGHRFDLSQTGFNQSVPPGAPERTGWHSENADTEGYALAGAKDPALDATIEAMTRSRDPATVLAATRAFDRVLRWQHYLVPLWHRDRIWLVHDARVTFPER